MEEPVHEVVEAEVLEQIGDWPFGHSRRASAAQDIVAAGLELTEVMQAGGWKSPVMVARYCEHLQARRGAAAKLAATQGRGGG